MMRGSRRQFLKDASLGVAGLALAAGPLRAFGKDESAAGQSAVPGGTANEPFKAVRYRPAPTKTLGLRKNSISLDGAWQIDSKPGMDARMQPLTATNWSHFRVPGQWAQQGYDVPMDQSIALAREFVIPAEWADYRIFLRFDAIHGGTTYWLNGQSLGYSENLFTPVEWEISGAAKAGQTNRLDLEMKVATHSERLSSSCLYTGYSLGGIDRAVRIYALPGIHVSSLHLSAGLDDTYQDGVLQIVLGFDNPGQKAEDGFAVTVNLLDAHGKKVEHSNPRIAVEPLQPGTSVVGIESQVLRPLRWNAEQPNLYKLVLVLEKEGKALERIERDIGFRTVETKDRQLYINGVRVKLAGVCHHEIDPLTGRADTMRHAEEDVRRFKSANLNHVRTSHYPCTQEFLDAADRLGFYVESEAPFCWVAPAKDLTDLQAMLTPVSAMIDYNHWHPSVIIWSLANESHWSALFDHSHALCKQLDPTRPDTIEHAFSHEDQVKCDIISRHYQKMPYDEILKDDPRPFLHGECFFLVYHERTDVAIDPGLRELWAHGSADPGSAWGQACIENIQGAAAAGPELLPGIFPGAWSYICESQHCIGSTIWSGVDDIAFLPDGTIVSSEGGNAFWGLFDGWRRPKPELWLSKFVFSPVWFSARQLDYQPGQSLVRVPVENHYSFTNLSQLKFVWELNGARGNARVNVPPGLKGELKIPIGTRDSQGATLLIRVMNGGSEVVNATLTLGQRQPAPLPQPEAGVPKWSDDGKVIIIEGRGFSLALDRTRGDFDVSNPKHDAPLAAFPSLHLTRHDFGDLDRKKAPYAALPDPMTRVVQSITAVEAGNALAVTVKDQYENFNGAVRWLIDKDGVGKVSYDYTYTGAKLETREMGIKCVLPAQYDELKWRRWSEWGIFPEESISRTEGIAKSRRDKKWPEQPINVKPAWPWSQDQTELGTADFRSIKFCIYEASLGAPDGSGVSARANADVHFRACLDKQGIKMHLLSQCPLGQVILNNGDRLTGDFWIQMISRNR